MTERRNIFVYTPPGDCPPYISIDREENGFVTITVRSGPHTGMAASDPTVTRYYNGPTATMMVPKDQWRKMIAAFAIEPDLWPGSQYSRPWYEDTEVGKPHGGPLS